MPRQRTGAPHFRHGKWSAQIYVSKGVRPTIELTTCTDEKQATVRTALLAELGAALARAGGAEQAPEVLRRAAGAPDATLRKAIELAARAVPTFDRDGLTFGGLANLWTSG